MAPAPPPSEWVEEFLDLNAFGKSSTVGRHGFDGAYLCFAVWLGKFLRVTVKVGTMRALGARLQDSNLAVAAGVLAVLFDHAPNLAFFVKDREGRYVAVNASLIKRHGYRHASQVLGRRPSDICPSDFGRMPAEPDAPVLRSGPLPP